MPNHTSYTAKLDQNDWDLTLDSNGDVAMIRKARAVCQNVANECRLFLHDAYFRYDEGINWFTDQISHPIRRILTENNLRQATESVEGVREIKSITIDGINTDNRVLSGVIEIETEEGDYGRIEL